MISKKCLFITIDLQTPGVHYRLIFNTTDTSELRIAELSPKSVRNSEILLCNKYNFLLAKLCWN